MRDKSSILILIYYSSIEYMYEMQLFNLDIRTLILHLAEGILHSLLCQSMQSAYDAVRQESFHAVHRD